MKIKQIESDFIKWDDMDAMVLYQCQKKPYLFCVRNYGDGVTVINQDCNKLFPYECNGGNKVRGMCLIKYNGVLEFTN